MPVKLEVILSSTDLSSDLFWACTETFFHPALPFVAIGIALGASFVHVGWVYARRVPPALGTLLQTLAGRWRNVFWDKMVMT